MPPPSLLRRTGDVFPPGRQRPSRKHPKNTSKEGNDAADVDTDTTAGKAFGRRFASVDPKTKEKMNHNTDRDHQKCERQALRLPSTHQRPTTRESRHLALSTRSPTSTE
jgi:hypothetical protein